MQIFESTSNQNTFKFNGLTYPKNFICIKQGGENIAIHNAYDTRHQLLGSTNYSDFEVDGITYNSQAELMGVLSLLLFSKSFNYVVQDNNGTRLVTAGALSLSGNSLTIQPTEWLINSIEYETLTNTTLTVPYAASGQTRIDIIVANSSGQIIRIAGVETSGIALAPIVPIDTVYISQMTINNNTIGTPSTPITGSIYVKKEEYSETPISTSGSTTITLSTESTAFRLVDSITEITGLNGDLYFFDTVYYVGKELKIANSQAIPVTLLHNQGGVDIPMVFPEGNDLVLAPDEVAIFKFIKTTATLAEFVSINRLASTATIPTFQQVTDQPSGNTTTNNVVINGQSIGNLGGNMYLELYRGSNSSASIILGNPDINQTSGLFINSTYAGEINNQKELFFSIGEVPKLKIDSGRTLSENVIKYSSDLSGSYDDRTLVDKGYVTSIISGITSNSFTGGTVSGATIFTGGLSANTIFSTGGLSVNDYGGNQSTYTAGYVDIYPSDGGIVTNFGGTNWSVSMGDDGTTMNPTNFFIQNFLGGTSYGVNSIDRSQFPDISNTYLFPAKTGSTYVGTFAMLDDITGTTINYLPLSGGTINGDIITNTISASTYYNLPIDITVTGGTYSNGTTVFTNNTGGTFSVTGYTTPFTGGTITGATIFTNGLTANTISATTISILSGDVQTQLNGKQPLVDNFSMHQFPNTAYASLTSYVIAVTNTAFSSTAANSNNITRFVPFVLDKAVAFDSFYIFQTSANAGAGAYMTMYIYDDSNDGFPGVKLHTDSLAVGSINNTNIVHTFSANTTLQAGMYWMAFHIRDLDTGGINPTFYYTQNANNMTIDTSVPSHGNNVYNYIRVAATVGDLGDNPVLSITSTSIPQTMFVKYKTQ